MLVWTDVETTGLDPEKELLLEVGVIITKDNLEEIDRRSWLIGYPNEEDIDELKSSCTLFIQEMHENSGLWDALRDGERAWALKGEGPLVSLGTAELELRNWLDYRWVKDTVDPDNAVRPPLCGNNVPFDRSWLKVKMPKVLESVHYRNIDVSTLKEVARRFGPGVFEKPEDRGEEKKHRAFDDLEWSIKEFRFYLEKMGWGL